MTRPRFPTFRLLLPLVLAGLSGSSPAARQAPEASHPVNATPAVTFRTEVNYVEVDAAVYTRDGQFVNDLRREDFEVREDGQPQDVNAFSLVNIPIERPDQPLYSTRPIAADIVTNARPFDGRLYVIVLDDLHIAATHTAQVRKAGKEFIERYMGTNDLAAVVHTSGRNEASQEFTSNKPLLEASIDKFIGQKLRSQTLERLDAYQRQQSIPTGPSGSSVSRIDDPLDAERGFRATRALTALENISDWVGSIRGRRKAIVYLSEGIDYDVYDFQKRETTTIVDAMREVIASATRSNVSIYAVDPRGLTNMGDDSIEVSGGFPADPRLNLSMTSFNDELRLAQQSLRSLAEDTGGYASVNSNDFASAWNRVVADNSAYYVLGSYPKNERRDGRFRKIEVRVKRDGVEVRARKGYTAPKGKAPTHKAPADDKASPELRQVLDSPVPLSGLTIRAYAAPFKGPAPNASIAIGVEAEGADLNFTEKEGKFVNDFELSAVAIDVQGKIRDGDRSLLNMGLKPETRARVAEQGLRIQTRLKLPPGKYQLRIAARETGGGRLGSVNYDLQVPDFAAAPLTMSGVVLASASLQTMMTAKPDEELRTLLPAPATAHREFPEGDTLALFAEVYDNDLKQPHKVDITTSVVTDDGRTVFSTNEERVSSELQGKPGGYGHTAQVPLKGFAPGLYVLKVQATSRAGKDITVSRELPFRVVKK
jgi:VWFA-related protein